MQHYCEVSYDLAVCTTR